MRKLLAAALIGLLFAGCRTVTTIAQRRSARAEAYSHYAQDVRDLIDRGQVAQGMDTDAVFIALGQPTKEISTETPAGATLEWRYYKSWVDLDQRWRIYYDRNNMPTVDSYHEPRSTSYLATVVEFFNGRVVTVQHFPPPF